ncbi:MAG: PhzF family phenazine biosynthesis protein [Bacteroidales bacterium]|nr:PhzF family phenazine biosynthesis protein [Bacteroidales bacterium]
MKKIIVYADFNFLASPQKIGILEDPVCGSAHCQIAPFQKELRLWIAKLFFEHPYPWNTIYEVVSNGFFVLWAIRIWCIRNNYFKILEK